MYSEFWNIQLQYYNKLYIKKFISIDEHQKNIQYISDQLKNNAPPTRENGWLTNYYSWKNGNAFI
jgi:hypothetical protein